MDNGVNPATPEFLNGKTGHIEVTVTIGNDSDALWRNV
jgi:hypothetical protein